MKEFKDILNVGINDETARIFEAQYPVCGMAYNSYLINDEKIAVFDTVDMKFGDTWFNNLEAALNGKSPDYLIVLHMEPDHSSNIAKFMERYTSATIVSSSKAFSMMKNFFENEYAERRIIISEGATLDLGSREISFIAAPMVHWPEVHLAYDKKDKILFSADAFGRFGENTPTPDWKTPARRYYMGIVAKYGAQVQALLKKAAGLEINAIFPLHGEILTENLGYYLNLYNVWSSYASEENGVAIFYTSVYGHTEKAVNLLEKELKEKNCPCVEKYNLAECDMSEAVSAAFRFDKAVFATTTYNMDVFPFMRDFLERLAERNFQNRTIGLMEDGSWAPNAVKVMQGILEKCKNLQYCENTVKILSEVSKENSETISLLAKELI